MLEHLFVVLPHTPAVSVTQKLGAVAHEEGQVLDEGPQSVLHVVLECREIVEMSNLAYNLGQFGPKWDKSETV